MQLHHHGEADLSDHVTQGILLNRWHLRHGGQHHIRWQLLQTQAQSSSVQASCRLLLMRPQGQHQARSPLLRWCGSIRYLVAAPLPVHCMLEIWCLNVAAAVVC